MIAVCTKCSTMFETTTEDAYTPGVLCPSCYKADKADKAKRQAAQPAQPAPMLTVDEFLAMSDDEIHARVQDNTH